MCSSLFITVRHFDWVEGAGKKKKKKKWQGTIGVP
jgi:hypothetical protein